MTAADILGWIVAVSLVLIFFAATPVHILVPLCIGLALIGLFVPGR